MLQRLLKCKTINQKRMDNRILLQRVIDGGQARYGKIRVTVVLVDDDSKELERTLVSENEIDSDLDIFIELHCTDKKQLELQGDDKNP